MRKHGKRRRKTVSKPPGSQKSEGLPPGPTITSSHELAKLRAVHRSLSRLTPDIAMHAPTLISHADAYKQAPVLLKRYASNVIVGRIIQYFATALMNAYNLVDMYLDGVRAGNPIAVYASTRGLLEILAIATGVKRTIKANAGTKDERFYERVLAVDEELLRATYGSRDKVFLDAVKQVGGGSRLKEMTQEDEDRLYARNVMGWIKDLDKREYPGALETYDQLSEYVHPNIGLNWMYLVLNEEDGTVEISRRRPEVMKRAVANTAEIMLEIAERMLDVCRQIQPPFGDTSQYIDRAQGVAPASLAQTVLSQGALAPEMATALRDAPRIIADEIAEFYFARSRRDFWPLAGLRRGGVPSAPVWVEMKQPSKVITDTREVTGRILPNAWGFILLPVGPKEARLAFPQIEKMDVGDAVGLCLAVMFTSGRIDTTRNRSRARRSGLEDLGVWLLPMASDELLAKRPALVSIRDGLVPEEVMKSAFDLLIPLLVALVRMAEEHPVIQTGRYYVLTVPEGWDAYAARG